MDLQHHDRYSSRHRGLLTFEASKLTRAQWNLAIARGDMELRHRDVARLYGAKSTQEMRIEAAVLAAGRGPSPRTDPPHCCGELSARPQIRSTSSCRVGPGKLDWPTSLSIARVT
jgi:hypothetical protein